MVLRDSVGVKVDEVTYRVGFPWPVAPNEGLGVSMELLNPTLDNDLGSSWRPASTKPTPGDENSVFVQNAPPNIRQVKHEPQSPKAGEPVTVSAKITDADGVGPVELLYQIVEPGDYIPLTDDSYESTWTAIEMVASEDPEIYRVTIPSVIQKHRHLVRRPHTRAAARW